MRKARAGRARAPVHDGQKFGGGARSWKFKQRAYGLRIRDVDYGFHPSSFGVIVGLHTHPVDASARELRSRAARQGAHIEIVSLLYPVDIDLHMTSIVRPGGLG